MELNMAQRIRPMARFFIIGGTPIGVDDVGAIQQIIGRERNQRACHRQLVRNAVVARRVNSTVMRFFL